MKTRRSLTLLAVLALLAPGKTVAGPPEVVPGRMVFDEAGAGLDRYRKEREPEKRARWLKKLAPTKDPRVAIALYEVYESRSDEFWLTAFQLILDYYCPQPPDEIEMYSMGRPAKKFNAWWKMNEFDLRRRAARLPP